MVAWATGGCVAVGAVVGARVVAVPQAARACWPAQPGLKQWISLFSSFSPPKKNFETWGHFNRHPLTIVQTLYPLESFSPRIKSWRTTFLNLRSLNRGLTPRVTRYIFVLRELFKCKQNMDKEDWGHLGVSWLHRPDTRDKVKSLLWPGVGQPAL